MRASRSPFDTLRRLSARERRFVAAGAATATGLLLITYAILPFVDRWTEREAAIRVRAEQAARLGALLEKEEEFARAERTLTQSREEIADRMLEGETQALAASQLQALLATYADRSRVALGRIDPAGATDSVAPGITAIPLQLVGSADVYGLVDFIAYIQGGDKLLIVDELGIRSNPERRDGTQTLSITLRLRGLYANEVGGPGEEAGP